MCKTNNVRQTFPSVDSTYIISPEALMRVPGLGLHFKINPYSPEYFLLIYWIYLRTCVARQPKLSFRLARITSSRSNDTILATTLVHLNARLRSHPLALDFFMR